MNERTKNPAATDLQYAVKWSGDLTLLSWSAAGLVTEQNTASLLIVRDSVPISGVAKRLYRVRLVKP